MTHLELSTRRVSEFEDVKRWWRVMAVVRYFWHIEDVNETVKGLRQLKPPPQHAHLTAV